MEDKENFSSPHSQDLETREYSLIPRISNHAPESGNEARDKLLLNRSYLTPSNCKLGIGSVNEATCTLYTGNFMVKYKFHVIID